MNHLLARFLRWLADLVAPIPVPVAKAERIPEHVDITKLEAAHFSGPRGLTPPRPSVRVWHWYDEGWGPGDYGDGPFTFGGGNYL